MARYESTPGTTKTFCRICGASLVTLYSDRPEIIGLPLGGVVGDLGPRRAFHIFVGSKAPWYEICDDLLRYDELPPGPDLIHEILD